jgi:hypothetical protein
MYKKYKKKIKTYSSFQRRTHGARGQAPTLGRPAEELALRTWGDVEGDKDTTSRRYHRLHTREVHSASSTMCRLFGTERILITKQSHT